MPKTETGLTLPELMITLVVLSVGWHFGHSMWHSTIPAWQVVADSNALLGLLHQARAEAVSGQVHVCDDQDCTRFGITGQLRLTRDPAHPTTLAVLTLSGRNSVSWHSFRGGEQLTFMPGGRTHYQNGHFLICHPGGAARRVVLNWTGRARIEHRQEDETRCMGRQRDAASQ